MMSAQYYEFRQVLIFMIFGRTDLRKYESGAKFDAESDFEVRLAVGPRNPYQNCEKLLDISNFFQFFVFGFSSFFRSPRVVGG